MPASNTTNTRGPAEAARVAAGLTLEQTAKALRKTPAYLRSIENGRRECSYILAMQLSSLYAERGAPCGLTPFCEGKVSQPTNQKGDRSKQEDTRQGEMTTTGGRATPLKPGRTPATERATRSEMLAGITSIPTDVAGIAGGAV